MKVEVTWVDAYLVNMWTTKDALEELVLPECRHIGILQFVDKEKLIITLGESDFDMIHAPFAIPVGCIIKVVDLDTKEEVDLKKIATNCKE